MKKAFFVYLGIMIWLLFVSVNLQAKSKFEKIPFRIDSHIHLYDTNREGSSIFLDPVKHEKIYYPHLVPEFLSVAGPAGVNYAIVVEASYRREDNVWAMSVVNESDNMLAFIANLDPRDQNYLTEFFLGATGHFQKCMAPMKAWSGSTINILKRRKGFLPDNCTLIMPLRHMD